MRTKFHTARLRGTAGKQHYKRTGDHQRELLYQISQARMILYRITRRHTPGRKKQYYRRGQRREEKTKHYREAYDTLDSMFAWATLSHHMRVTFDHHKETYMERNAFLRPSLPPPPSSSPHIDSYDPEFRRRAIEISFT